jgi:hypothetical protein
MINASANSIANMKAHSPEVNMGFSSFFFFGFGFGFGFGT